MFFSSISIRQANGIVEMGLQAAETNGNIYIKTGSDRKTNTKCCHNLSGVIDIIYM